MARRRTMDGMIYKDPLMQELVGQRRFKRGAGFAGGFGRPSSARTKIGGFEDMGQSAYYGGGNVLIDEEGIRLLFTDVDVPNPFIKWVDSDNIEGIAHRATIDVGADKAKLQIALNTGTPNKQGAEYEVLLTSGDNKTGRFFLVADEDTAILSARVEFEDVTAWISNRNIGDAYSTHKISSLFGFENENVTISSGTLIVSQSYVIVNGEGAAADDLNNILPAETNVFLLLTRATGSGDVTLKNQAGGSGEIHLAGDADFVMSITDFILLFNSGGADWFELTRSNN